MANVKKFNALIVDDDSIVRAMNMKYLTRNGFQVEIAENGQEAVEYFHAGNRFDLVIMDMEMPIMDGFQVYNIIICMYNNIPTLL